MCVSQVVCVCHSVCVSGCFVQNPTSKGAGSHKGAQITLTMDDNDDRNIDKYKKIFVQQADPEVAKIAKEEFES